MEMSQKHMYSLKTGTLSLRSTALRKSRTEMKFKRPYMIMSWICDGFKWSKGARHSELSTRWILCSLFFTYAAIQKQRLELKCADHVQLGAFHCLVDRAWGVIPLIRMKVWQNCAPHRKHTSLLGLSIIWLSMMTIWLRRMKLARWRLWLLLFTSSHSSLESSVAIAW